jgi:hypothetical protein
MINEIKFRYEEGEYQQIVLSLFECTDDKQLEECLKFFEQSRTYNQPYSYVTELCLGVWCYESTFLHNEELLEQIAKNPKNLAEKMCIAYILATLMNHAEFSSAKKLLDEYLNYETYILNTIIAKDRFGDNKNFVMSNFLSVISETIREHELDINYVDQFELLKLNLPEEVFQVLGELKEKGIFSPNNIRTPDLDELKLYRTIDRTIKNLKSYDEELVDGFLNENLRYMRTVLSEAGIEGQFRFRGRFKGNHALATAFYDSLVQEPLFDRFTVVGVECDVFIPPTLSELEHDGVINFFNPQSFVVRDKHNDKNIRIEMFEPWGNSPGLSGFQKGVATVLNYQLRTFVANELVEESTDYTEIERLECEGATEEFVVRTTLKDSITIERRYISEKGSIGDKSVLEVSGWKYGKDGTKQDYFLDKITQAYEEETGNPALEFECSTYMKALIDRNIKLVKDYSEI